MGLTLSLGESELNRHSESITSSSLALLVTQVSLMPLCFNRSRVSDLLVSLAAFELSRSRPFVVRLVGAGVLGVSCISWVSHVDHCNWDM
jgi:hypothetical protein